MAHARLFRRKSSKEEKQLWQALRAGRFAGFKFRRQHPLGNYFLDFFCPLAQVSVELDGFAHGLPHQRQHDLERARFLELRGIKELRFWNHQWRHKREGVLLEIWDTLHERTGCVQISRMESNQRYVPPDPRLLLPRPPKPQIWYPPGTAPLDRKK